MEYANRLELRNTLSPAVFLCPMQHFRKRKRSKTKPVLPANGTGFRLARRGQPSAGENRPETQTLLGHWQDQGPTLTVKPTKSHLVPNQMPGLDSKMATKRRRRSIGTARAGICGTWAGTDDLGSGAPGES